MQARAAEFGRQTNVSVRIARINEGRAGHKAVEKVPFFFWDAEARQLSSCMWGVREFRREHSSDHAESHCSEKCGFPVSMLALSPCDA